MDNIKPKIFASFQTFQDVTSPPTGSSEKEYNASFTEKRKANDLLQKYYVKNAGSVIINPQLNSSTQIFTPDEIKRIKNLTGTIESKVDIVKAMYLEKRGYDKDLVDVEFKGSEFSHNGAAGNFDPVSGKVVLYIDQDQNKTNEELASIIYHELRHFEQHARTFKIVGLENAISEHDNSIYKMEQELKESIRDLEEEVANICDDDDFAEIKRQYQDVITSQKAMLEELSSHRLNRSFWEKAIAQTKARENFSKDLTLKNWLYPESCPRLEEYDDGITYEDVEYYTNPYEVDAYNFEIRVEEELGIPSEDNKKLLELNAKLKNYLKILYDRKTSKSK